MRVLVIDDEADVADLATMYFVAMGFECQPSYSAKMGLVVAEVWTPNLVFIDVGLKDRCGLDIVEDLRKLCAKSAVIVGVSGWGTKKDFDRAYAAGVDKYIVKPFGKKNIDEMIDLAKRRLG